MKLTLNGLKKIRDAVFAEHDDQLVASAITAELTGTARFMKVPKHNSKVNIPIPNIPIAERVGEVPNRYEPWKDVTIITLERGVDFE